MVGLRGPLVAAALVAFLATQPATAATLTEAVQTAIATNPDIGVMASNRDAIMEDLRQARGLFLPQLDFSAGIGPGTFSDPSTRARGAGQVDGVSRDLQTNLTQRVFDGFEASSQVDRQISRVQSAARRVAETAEVLALEAVNAYLEVGRQRQLRQLAENNVRIHLDILEDLKRQQAGGAGSTADVFQAEGRLSRARATLTQTTNDLRDAEATYLRVVGQMPDDVVLPDLPSDKMPSGVEATLEEIVRGNPSLTVTEADIGTAEADVAISESAYYPKVNVEAFDTRIEDNEGLAGWTREQAAILRMRWNLYRGGIDAANRRASVQRVAEAKGQRDRVLRRVRAEATQAWNAYELAGDRADQLRRAVIFNEQTRDAYRQQFRVAQRTLLDVLDAENELFVSRGQLITAEVAQRSAAYRLLSLTGQLLATLGVERPAQANEAVPSFFEHITQ